MHAGGSGRAQAYAAWPAMSDPIYQNLNEAQAAAVAHGEGPLMVLAGAGSGKTRVVTRRIARLMRDGVRSSQVLAMTFTNKAAGEMAHRVQQLGGEYVRVATFHSACARFLRQDGHQLGFRPTIRSTTPTTATR
jgi:DNA helicase-2/ATP-dependent DNA helicase PcrA